MDLHQANLQHFCRLCAQYITCHNGRSPHVKQKFSNNILSAVGVDIVQDDDNVHPPFLCNTCRLKLRRWKQKGYKRGACTLDVHNFEPHSLSCWVCFEQKDDSLERQQLFDTTEQIAKVQGYFVTISENRIFCIKLGDDCRKVTRRVTVHKDGTWDVEIHGQQPQNCELLNEFPVKIQSNTVEKLLKVVSNSQVCIGNPGFDFICRNISPNSPAMFYTATGDIGAFEEDGYLKCGTVRKVGCQLLTKSTKQKCTVCLLYHGDLTSRRNRLEKTPTLTQTKFIRNDRLPQEKLQEKAKTLQKEKKSLKKQVSTLKEKIMASIEATGETIESTMSDCLSTIMLEQQEGIFKEFPKDSPQRLLWEQQLKAATSSKTGRRWHPTMIKWCISLYLKSPSAYKMIRNSRFLILPHANTLRDYTFFTNTDVTGYNPDVLERIKSDIQFDDLPDFKKNVTVIFDEMKVKAGLVYSKTSGKLVGFSDLGDVNKDIELYVTKLTTSEEQSYNDQSGVLATHVIAVMVRGIFCNLCDVFGWFPSKTCDSNQLMWLLWPAVRLLEYSDFYVRAMVSDGATPNRKFYKLSSSDGEGYYVPNPQDPSRKIYFICDVPHLIKTARNNWENSGWHNKTRNLHYQHQAISWVHLVRLVEDDIGITGTAGTVQLRKLPRITYEHLHLTPPHRMKVKLAAQVLSSSVANAFEAKGRHDTKSTEKFVRMIDQFFDCMNVSRLGQHIKAKKPALAPYTDQHDWRFQWLQEDFIGFLDDWEQECLNTPNMTLTEKRKMCLSNETLHGFRTTVKSFVSLSKELLVIPGVQYLLSDRFNQDPLEEYFSRQRGCVGRNDNPTVQEFSRNAIALQVAGSRMLRASVNSNCSNQQRDEGEISTEPLPRRRRVK